MKAMLLAAGLGTRLKPWTDKHPKALAPVSGKSLLQRNIEYLQRAGITEVLVNVHHFADQILAAIEAHSGWGSKIAISDETGEVLETGGGLKKAAHFFKSGDDFLLMNVDILTDLSLADFIKEHKASGHLATLAVSDRPSSRYFLFDGRSGLLGGWENITTGEQKIMRAMAAPVQKAFSGMHCLRSDIFPLLQREGKFSIVDVYLDLCKSWPVGYFDHTGSRFVDVGKPQNVELAEKMFT